MNRIICKDRLLALRNISSNTCIVIMRTYLTNYCVLIFISTIEGYIIQKLHYFDIICSIKSSMLELNKFLKHVNITTMIFFLISVTTIEPTILSVHHMLCAQSMKSDTFDSLIVFLIKFSLHSQSQTTINHNHTL